MDYQKSENIISYFHSFTCPKYLTSFMLCLRKAYFNSPEFGGIKFSLKPS